MNRIKASSNLYLLGFMASHRNPGKRENTIIIISNIDYHPDSLAKANVNLKSINEPKPTVG
jgi:hypothetical protein